MNYDNIPNELQNRDQWLLWDGDYKTPRHPHWRGDFTVSFNDPEEWHTFDEAVDAASEKDSWGIGYVTAMTNDDHPRGLYGVIDIDTGLVDGELADFVPDLDKFEDCYIERSPSGTGLHIPFVGYKPPEWWRDSQIDDHTGVDVLTNKFCTFTGDVYQEGPICDDNPTAWLYKAYESIRDEAPRLETKSKNQGDYNGDSDLTEEQVKTALDHVDPDLHYTEWLKVGMAVYDWDSTATGKGVFERWSKSNPKWDKSDGQHHINDIWDNDSPNGDVTVGTLVFHAKEGGWTPPKPDGGTTTAKADQNDAEVETGGEYAVDIKPSSVRVVEGLDDDERLADLPARDLSYSATKVIMRNSDVHIANVEPDNTLHYCNDDTVWVDEGENELRRQLQTALGRAYEQHVKSESEEWVMGTMGPDLRREDLGAPEWRVPVGNGLLDLEKVMNGTDAEDAIRELRPDDRALNRLQAEYVPGADAPQFQQFLEEVCRPEDIPKLQEYAGYLLYHWGQPFKKSIVLLGPTDSGKSTFTKIMREMVGQQNVATETLYDLISTNWGTAQLFGKMVNIRNELTSSELKRPERFKEITGGEEQINAEKKREQKFQFVVTQKFLFSTNEVPKIEGADEAFYNRWLFATFPHTIPVEEQDEGLDTRIIENELPGVLNWTLEGLNRLLKQGEFTNARSIDEKKSLWQSKSGLIARFKEDILNVTGDDSDTIKKSDAHSMLTAYADYQGKEAPTQHKLTRELKGDSEIADKEQSGNRYYTGVQFAKESIGGRKPLGNDREQQRF